MAHPGDYLFSLRTQQWILAVGIILLVCVVLFFQLRKKSVKILVLVIVCVLLCELIGAKREEGSKAEESQAEESQAEEMPTWERQSEYRYSGIGTVEDAVANMEEFLRSHYGKEAENFKRMTFRNYWRYQYKGVNTDYVYSFRIEQGETVICDNTGGADLSQIKARIDEFLSKYHPDAKSDAVWMQKRRAYLSTEVGSLEYNYTVGSVLYCAEDDRFYEFMQYDVVNDEGWHAARDVIFDPIVW